MQVEVFTLCDAASYNKDGKLTMMGAFDTLFAEAMPAKHAHCALAIRIRLEEADGIGSGTEHTLDLSFTDAKGQAALVGVRSKTVTLTHTDVSPTAMLNHILTINGLIINAFGTYHIALAVDGQRLIETPFYVRPTT